MDSREMAEGSLPSAVHMALWPALGFGLLFGFLLLPLLPTPALRPKD
jgi:hypothetical protein